MQRAASFTSIFLCFQCVSLLYIFHPTRLYTSIYYYNVFNMQKRQKEKLTEAVVNRLRGSYQLFSTGMLKRCREFFNMVRVG